MGMGVLVLMRMGVRVLKLVLRVLLVLVGVLGVVLLLVVERVEGVGSCWEAVCVKRGARQGRRTIVVVGVGIEEVDGVHDYWDEYVIGRAQMRSLTNQLQRSLRPVRCRRASPVPIGHTLPCLFWKPLFATCHHHGL